MPLIINGVAKKAAPPPLPVDVTRTVERWPIADLKPYDRNPRTHSDAQVDQIAASLMQYGWTNPILVDPDGGVIAGHGRLMAAKRIGLPEVPVIVLDGLTDAQKRAYVIADNKLALNAGWDDTLLMAELSELKLQDFDLNLTGFTAEEINALTDPGSAPAKQHGQLAERFGVPPFSVLNARDGWWQERKKAWIALGIRSELGRGETAGSKLAMSETVQTLKPSADQALKRSRTFGGKKS